MEHLVSHIRNLPSIATFKRLILDFIRPVPTKMFKINWLSGFVFLTWLSIGFSHLREPKFRHGFSDIADPICFCRTNAVENTEHCFLHGSSFANQRTILFDERSSKHRHKLWSFRFFYFFQMLLFGNPNFSDNVNSGIIYAVIKFIESTNHFSGSIYE